MRKALEKAQFQAWPDSVILTDGQMMRAMQSEPRWVQDLTIENWPEKGQYTDVERGFVFLTYKQTETRAQQLLWARAAFMDRSDYPDGFFYACCKGEDGTYRHVGFRYGVKESEYMSGYSGLTYKPV